MVQLLLIFSILFVCLVAFSGSLQHHINTHHEKYHVLHHHILQRMHHEATVNTDAASFDSSPIVILHGLLGSSRNFRTWSHILHQKFSENRDVISLDLRNHGKSSTKLGPLPVQYEAMAMDVATTLNELKVTKCHIVGHSMGGKVGAAMAISPKVEELYKGDILSLTMMDISPIAYSKEDLDQVVYSIHSLYNLSKEFEHATITKEQLTSRIQSLFAHDPTMALFLLSNMQLNSQGKVQWSFQIDSIYKSLDHILSFIEPPHDDDDVDDSDYVPTRRLWRSTIPTLLMKGSKSKFIRAHHLPVISSLFPRYTLKTIRDAAHWLHIDQPEQSASAYVEFIQQVVPASQ